MFKKIMTIAGPVGLVVLVAGGMSYSIMLSKFISASLVIVGLALILAFLVVRNDMVREFLRRRSARYGSNAAILIVLVLGILFAINFVSSRHHLRSDLTENKLHSFSDQTVKVLKGLEKEVRIISFYGERQRGEEKSLKNIIKEYSYYTDKIKHDPIDPDKNPVMAKRYAIGGRLMPGTVVVESGGKEERITHTVNPGEKELTSAIMKVTRDVNKKIYFTTGHGEREMKVIAEDGYKIATDKLKESNYDVDQVVLAREGRVPQDCSVLLVVNPITPFLDVEIDAVRKYLEDGGKAMFSFEPGVNSGLEGMLEEWDFIIGDDFIVDVSPVRQLLGISDYSMPIAVDYGVHEITEKHKQGIMTLYPLVRSVSLDKDRGPDIHGRELVKTSDRSWAETDLTPLKVQGKKPEFNPVEDKIGPISIAAAVEAKPKNPAVADNLPSEEEGIKTKIVVFGDADFASNKLFYMQGNGDLFMNAMAWLAEEEALITIRPKLPGYNPVMLTRRQGRGILWFTWVIFPAVILLSGLGIWWRRK